MNAIIKTVAAAASLVLIAGQGAAQSGWAPDKPAEFVIASGAGGGTDNFPRTIQSVIAAHNLMPVGRRAEQGRGIGCRGVPVCQGKRRRPDQVALIEQTTGADFKYVPFNGGGEVGVQLAGGHVAANLNNPNENIGQWQAGAIRPLCVFSPQRMAKGEPVHDGKGWGDIPTCAEQGVDITSYQMPRTVWLPAGVPPEAVAYYADVLKKVSETPEWADYVAKTWQSGTYLSGADFAKFVTDSETGAVKVFEAQGWTAK